MQIKSLWDSQSEGICFNILKEFINIEAYDIACHVHLSNIFHSDEKQNWSNYHVDFLIIDKKGFPALAIEINGPEHLNSSEVREHEKMKKQLFMEHDIPIIFIPITEIPYSEKDIEAFIGSLKLMLQRFLNPFIYRSSYPVYSWRDKVPYLYRCRKDGGGTFYAIPDSEKTFSVEKIPPLLNEKIFE